MLIILIKINKNTNNMKTILSLFMAIQNSGLICKKGNIIFVIKCVSFKKNVQSIMFKGIHKL